MKNIHASAPQRTHAGWIKIPVASGPNKNNTATQARTAVGCFADKCFLWTDSVSLTTHLLLNTFITPTTNYSTSLLIIFLFPIQTRCSLYRSARRLVHPPALTPSALSLNTIRKLSVQRSMPGSENPAMFLKKFKDLCTASRCW